MKGGYSEEFKCACLGLALCIVLFSPDIVSRFEAWIPEADSQIAFIASYAAFLALAYVTGIVIDGILPYSVKEWLLYPSYHGKGLLRPGCRVFDKIASGEADDYRFELDKARELYVVQIETAKAKQRGDSARYQNGEWYKLYRKHSSSTSVQSNNIEHLYSRDVYTLSVMTLLLCLLCNVACLVVQRSPLISPVSMVCIGIIGVLCWFSAIEKARRLVFTVIACDIAERTKG